MLKTILPSFARKNHVFVEVVALLQQFPDLDKMLSGLTSNPKKITQKTARVGIDTLIYLKQTLRTAPLLANALEEFDSAPITNVPDKLSLMSTIMSNLREPALSEIENKILSHITESTTYSKSAHEMRHQECFAFKTGIHGLLDVSRKTFLQTVEELYFVSITHHLSFCIPKLIILQLADRYSLEFGVPIKVAHSTSRGYFLSVPATLDPLPPGFTQAVLYKRTISCSTEEFSSLSDRAGEAITQALTLTHELIQSLLSEIRESINSLFTVTDSVVMSTTQFH
jgi:DNA mismatch repair protein MSH4